MLMWILVIFLAVLTIILLSGKGSFLVAGYNTASQAQKARYNKQKLSRVMGIGLGLITILVAVFAALQENAPDYLLWLLPIAIIVIVIVMTVLSNTICKTEPGSHEEESPQAQKLTKKTRKFVWIITGIILVFTIGLTFTGDVKVQPEGDSLQIEVSYWSDKTIPYEDIKSAQYEENIKTGERTNGLGSARLQAGHFRNKQFGNYLLYAYTKCDSFIVLKTTNGTVVINAKDESGTMKLYEQITKKM